MQGGQNEIIGGQNASIVYYTHYFNIFGAFLRLFCAPSNLFPDTSASLTHHHSVLQKYTLTLPGRFLHPERCYMGFYLNCQCYLFHRQPHRWG